MSRKEKLEAFPTGHPNQFEVRNNFNELAGDWDESYVTFSGYFGKHGPHVFAAAPDLLDALEDILAADSKRTRDQARAAISKAKGGNQ